MVVYNSICTRINKEPVGFLHSETGQLEMLMTSMHYDQNEICFVFSLLNGIILLNWIKRVGACRLFSSNRKLMLATIDDGNFLSLYILIQYAGCLLKVS